MEYRCRRTKYLSMLPRHLTPTTVPVSLTKLRLPDDAEVSWQIGTQPSITKPPVAHEDPAEVGSGWIVALAAALFVYNVLLCLGYPVSSEQFDSRLVSQYTQQLWTMLFPLDPLEHIWPVPDLPIQHTGPVRVQPALLLGHAAASVLVGGQSVTELTAEGRVEAQTKALARGDPEYNPTDDAMVEGVPVVMRALISSGSWPALARWTPEYVAKAMPTVKPHISTDRAIRMHSIVHPLGQVRPFAVCLCAIGGTEPCCCAPCSHR